MCLGVPGRIIEIAPTTGSELPTAIVAFGGVKRHACIALTPDAALGDYVLVHAGIAIEKIDERQAAELLAHLHAMEDGELADLTRGESPS